MKSFRSFFICIRVGGGVWKGVCKNVKMKTFDWWRLISEKHFIQLLYIHCGNKEYNDGNKSQNADILLAEINLLYTWQVSTRII